LIVEVKNGISHFPVIEEDLEACKAQQYPFPLHYLQKSKTPLRVPYAELTLFTSQGRVPIIHTLHFLTFLPEGSITFAESPWGPPWLKKMPLGWAALPLLTGVLQRMVRNQSWSICVTLAGSCLMESSAGGTHSSIALLHCFRRQKVELGMCCWEEADEHQRGWFHVRSVRRKLERNKTRKLLVF
jgi:hypothetical protein